MSERKSHLTELQINSLGVIESATIEFGTGFNVLTGETGAGKTMVLTALALLSGGKADSDFVRKGSQRLSASARFDIGANKVIQTTLAELGAEAEANEVLLTRTVNLDGKSRAHLGGQQVTATNLATICDQLLEIHGQSANARLNKPAYQRELLDRFAGNESEEKLRSYREQFTRVKELAKQVTDLRNSLKEREKEIASLKEFHEAIGKIKPLPGELQQIDNEISRLDSVEALRIAAGQAHELLNREELNPLTEMNVARKSLESVKSKDDELDHIAEQFAEATIELQEISGALARYMSALDADPRRLEFLNERKSAINQLIKRFGRGSDREVAYDQLLDDGENVARRISDLHGGDARVEELEAQRDDAFTLLRKYADALTHTRVKWAAKLSAAVTSEIVELAMPNASFEVKVVTKESAKFSEFTESGLDEVEMVFTSHKDGALLPINKTASGGELSRLMLGLEVVIAGTDPVGTYVFDEVDAGVGGKAAIEVGRRLAKLSRSTQVIVVTHLPQVAAWADHHFVVAKSETGAITESSVRKINTKEREIEIARMLSGQENSQIAQQHAQELLELIRS